MAVTRSRKVADHTGASAINSAICGSSERTRDLAPGLCAVAAVGNSTVSTRMAAHRVWMGSVRELRVIGVHLRRPRVPGPHPQRQERRPKPISGALMTALLAGGGRVESRHLDDPAGPD